MFFLLIVLACSQKFVFENDACSYLESVDYYVRSKVSENICFDFEKYVCLEDRVRWEKFNKVGCSDLADSDEFGLYERLCTNGIEVKCETEEDMRKKLAWDNKKFVELTLDCNESGEKEKIIARADSEDYYRIPPLEATFQFVCNENGTIQILQFTSIDPLVKEEIPATGCQTITGKFYGNVYYYDIMVSDFDCVGIVISNESFVVKVTLFMYILVLMLYLS